MLTLGLVAAGTVVSHALARSAYPILLPAIEDELLADHQQAGLLSTVNFSAYLVGVAAVTSVSGRVEPVRLLRVGLAVAAAGFAALAAAHGVALLVVGQCLAGLGSAAIWMSVPVLATGAVGPSRRGTVMGLLSSTMGVGIVATGQGTNLVRAVTGDDGAWRPTFVGAAVFSAALLGAVAAWLRTPPTTSIEGGVSLRFLRTLPRWGSVTAAYWLSGLIVSSFTPFFGAALEEAGFSRGHVANLYSLFGVAAALGAVTLGRLSDRVGRRPVLTAALLALAVASLLVLAGREPWATVAAALFGVASFTFPVLIAAHLSDHIQGRAFANALGALTLVYGTALAGGPALAGTLGDSRFGFDAVFVGTAVIATVAVAFVHRFRASAPLRPVAGDSPAG